MVETLSRDEGRALIEQERSKKPHKYRAKPMTVDGHRFASTLEAKRYSELKMLERAGNIRRLKLQPRFPLVVEGALVGTYVADFAYDEAGCDRWLSVVEDAKGAVLPLYTLKLALFRVLNPDVSFREIRRR